MTPAFTIAVYCGSRPGTLPAYAHAAVAVGTWIGRHQGQLVYGGGNSGLMGIVANATKAAGGRVVGVIPHALAAKEIAKHDCDELYQVDTMHERKQIMAERADAFLALPGGIGTFEELFEVWTWRQLEFHNKPMGLLNVDGYYDGLCDFMRTTVSQGFVSDWHVDFVQVSDDVQTLMPQLVEAAGLAKSDGLGRI